MVRQAHHEGIWRQEKLKVPARQPKRGRLWLGDGSCIRLRPERRDRVWAYDLVEERTHDGRKFRTLNVVEKAERLELFTDTHVLGRLRRALTIPWLECRS